MAHPEPDLTLTPENLGRRLILEILCDVGAINRIEPDSEDNYPASYVDLIGCAAVAFFTKFPEMLTDDELMNIASPGQDSNDRFLNIPDHIQDDPTFIALNETLNHYFREYIG